MHEPGQCANFSLRKAPEKKRERCRWFDAQATARFRAEKNARSDRAGRREGAAKKGPGGDSASPVPHALRRGTGQSRFPPCRPGGAACALGPKQTDRFRHCGAAPEGKKRPGLTRPVLLLARNMSGKCQVYCILCIARRITSDTIRPLRTPTRRQPALAVRPSGNRQNTSARGGAP